jgi:hypothetical protein
MPSKALAMAVACLIGAAVPAVAQGRMTNARIESRTVSTTLEREVQAIAASGQATWIGYRTPMAAGERRMCCSDSIAPPERCCGVCRLESGGGLTMSRGDNVGPAGAPILLEPPADILILIRLENGIVTRLRTFTPDCDLDGGGMPIVWLENVRAADSEAWLTTLARTAGTRDRESRVVRPAISALAVHPGQSAVRSLVALAREDQRAGVRGQALFWLSQRAGDEAVAAIRGAVDADPETDVKRRAVFALGQLPHDEGVPLLIEIARTHRNLEVRRQAMFWLGQSKDARAISFFEEVLTK